MKCIKSEVASYNIANIEMAEIFIQSPMNLQMKTFKVLT